MTNPRARLHPSPNRTQRFRAAVLQQGLNPYVEVPADVSRALASRAVTARGGRIFVEGVLNDTPFRATLVPVEGGGHRLYVNGGLRSAAGVAAGDRASFTLTAVNPDQVRPPADVEAALARMRGAHTVFEGLSPSHRRELLRYIDDARSDEAREGRIAKTVDYLLGQPVPAERPIPERALWTCPKCGNEFVNRNQFHSCRRHDLSEPFAGKPPRVRQLFDRFRAMVEACGPVKLQAYHDKVGFMVRVRFAGAFPRTRWLDVGFWLPRRIDSARFHKIETIYPNAHVHSLRITAPDQLDAEVDGWIKEAYAVGCQGHLVRKGKGAPGPPARSSAGGTLAGGVSPRT